uniref:Mothers against decapentaplegic homolog n=1 Tax=Macrostomum lignano TaxID=282301 RepID=A0A1I8FSD9_9PLAT
SLAGLIGGAHSSSVKRLVSLAVQAQPQPPTDGAGKEKAVKSLIKRLKKNEQAKLLERALSEQNAATACVTATVGDSAIPSRCTWSPAGCGAGLTCRLRRSCDRLSTASILIGKGCDIAMEDPGAAASHSPPILFPDFRSRFVGDLCVNPMHYQRLLAGATSQEPVIVYSAAAAIAAAAAAGPVFSFNGAAAGTSGSTASSPTAAGAPSPALSNQAMQQQLQQQLGGLLSVPYMDAEHWCSVHYYELSSRVGDAYYATSPFVTVDGGTNPSGRGRFCLGLLSNVNRTLAVEQTRGRSGRASGSTMSTARCTPSALSDSPVFIQSPNGNIRHNWHPATVCRIPPGCNLCVFSIRDFGNSCARVRPRASTRLGAASTGASWVTATPCWIEVHLNGPLRWLDQVLSTMGSPNYG